MSITETIYAHVKDMPVKQAREVLNFIEFLESKTTKTPTELSESVTLSRQAISHRHHHRRKPTELSESVTLSRQEWDNLQETIYVLQNSTLITQIAQSMSIFNQSTSYVLHGTAINADANGAYNILRKSNPKFSFSQLTKKIGEGILDWLHPYTRLKIG